MTIAQLIEELQKFPADAPVYVMSGYDCDIPGPPEPEWRYQDEPDYPWRGVYL